ncbi:YciI family protein [Nonomuraea thailandensis]
MGPRVAGPAAPVPGTLLRRQDEEVHDEVRTAALRSGELLGVGLGGGDGGGAGRARGVRQSSAGARHRVLGEALKPAAQARSLRPSDQGPVSTGGPFVALSQDLAGYYLIDCADLDEAEEIARHCPLGAGIEIRPVWDGPS